MGCGNSSQKINEQSIIDSDLQKKENTNLQGGHQGRVNQEVHSKPGGNAQISQRIQLQKNGLQKVQQQQAMLKDIYEKDQQFTDTEFPPQYSSISYAPDEIMQTYVWRRVTEFLVEKETLVLFDKIEPQDIKQGSLGDCFFLSALSVLAEKPHMITKLFEQKTINSQGCYAIWLCINGEWRQIIIDDFIPCYAADGGPAFSEGHGDEIWVLLLEKAYAKAYDGGYTSNALRDMTGSPYTSIQHKFGKEAQIWEFLMKNQKDKNLITSSSQSSKKGIEVDNGFGIVSSHAYGILDVREVQTEEGQQKLIQIRNPWGNKEWKGNWSDKSNSWTDKLKKELNWVDSDDGIFWIGIDDYCREFAETRANLEYDDYLYVSYRMNMYNTRCVSINFIVSQPNTHGYISITQKNEIFFRPSKDKYLYSGLSLIIIQGTTSKIIKTYGGSYEQDSDCYLEILFEQAGQYTAIVTVDWTQNHSNNIVISSYSKNSISFQNNFQSISKEQELDLLKQVILNFRNNDREIYQYDNPLFTRYFELFAGYLFIVYTNQSKNCKLIEKYYTLNNNISLLYPNMEQIQVNQQESFVSIYTVKSDPKGNGRYDYEYKVSDFKIFVSYTENELKQRCLKEGQKSERSQQQMQEKTDMEYINFYTLELDDGLCFYYVNKIKMLYEEVLTVISENLKCELFDVQMPYKFTIKPGQSLLLRFQKIDQFIDYNIESSYTSSLKKI